MNFHCSNFLYWLTFLSSSETGLWLDLVAWRMPATRMQHPYSLHAMRGVFPVRFAGACSRSTRNELIVRWFPHFMMFDSRSHARYDGTNLLLSLFVFCDILALCNTYVRVVWSAWWKMCCEFNLMRRSTSSARVTLNQVYEPIIVSLHSDRAPLYLFLSFWIILLTHWPNITSTAWRRDSDRPTTACYSSKLCTQVVFFIEGHTAI